MRTVAGDEEKEGLVEGDGERKEKKEESLIDFSITTQNSIFIDCL